MSDKARQNAPVPDVPFFSPIQTPSPGTAKTLNAQTPTIFHPLRIRGVSLKNRICVSPMCQYSCAPSGPQTGVMGPLYLATLGHYAYKGAALAMVEATGVQPNGRISVNCPGLYNDAQEAGLKTVADFVHSQGGLLGVQLSHGGRKAGTLAPWIANGLGQPSAKAEAIEGGWPDEIVGPSGGQSHTFDGKQKSDPTGGYHEPREMSRDDIAELIRAYQRSAARAVSACIDTIEIHAAHGYLLHQFLSPLTNHRRDEYGGSFKNRIRLTIEIIQAVRAAIPDSMPLFVRISATDWMEDTEKGRQLGSWDLPSTIRLAKMLSNLGVDVLDVSSAGNVKEATHTVFNAGQQQADFAAKVRSALKAVGSKLLIGAVGEITDATQARNLLQDNDGQAACDLISVGRQFLREPGWVLKVAQELGVDAAWPVQIARPQIHGQVVSKL